MSQKDEDAVPDCHRCPTSTTKDFIRDTTVGKESLLVPGTRHPSPVPRVSTETRSWDTTPSPHGSRLHGTGGVPCRPSRPRPSCPDGFGESPSCRFPLPDRHVPSRSGSTAVSLVGHPSTGSWPTVPGRSSPHSDPPLPGRIVGSASRPPVWVSDSRDPPVRRGWTEVLRGRSRYTSPPTPVGPSRPSHLRPGPIPPDMGCPGKRGLWGYLSPKRRDSVG